MTATRYIERSLNYHYPILRVYSMLRKGGGCGIAKWLARRSGGQAGPGSIHVQHGRRLLLPIDTEETSAQPRYPANEKRCLLHCIVT